VGAGKKELVAALRVTRKTSFGIERRRGVFEIVPDGKSIGTVEHSKTVEAAIDPGRHVLKIRSGRYSSHNRSFGTADREAAGFRCHGAMVWPRWVASLVKPDLAIALIRE
jgi:hypothetical protein